MVSCGPEGPPACQIFEKWRPLVDFDNFSCFLTSSMVSWGPEGPPAGQIFEK